jgi:hypothetical protein
MNNFIPEEDYLDLVWFGDEPEACTPRIRDDRLVKDEIAFQKIQKLYTYDEYIKSTEQNVYNSMIVHKPYVIDWSIKRDDIIDYLTLIPKLKQFKRDHNIPTQVSGYSDRSESELIFSLELSNAVEGQKTSVPLLYKLSRVYRNMVACIGQTWYDRLVYHYGVTETSHMKRLWTILKFKIQYTRWPQKVKNKREQCLKDMQEIHALIRIESGEMSFGDVRSFLEETPNKKAQFSKVLRFIETCKTRPDFNKIWWPYMKSKILRKWKTHHRYNKKCPDPGSPAWEVVGVLEIYNVKGYKDLLNILKDPLKVYPSVEMLILKTSWQTEDMEFTPTDLSCWSASFPNLKAVFDEAGELCTHLDKDSKLLGMKVFKAPDWSDPNPKKYNHIEVLNWKSNVSACVDQVFDPQKES